MSSVGDQLAALRSQTSKNPGSIAPPPSKNRADNAGRGLWGKAAKHPSLLYEQKDVVDIPLEKLRENASNALESLVEIDADFQHYHPLVEPSSVKTERELLTLAENKSVDHTIRNLLPLLSSALGDSATKLSALHVLEYLLRRYDVHVRNAQELLIMATPHHEDQSFFLRLLRLVDLTTVPSFLFLRPFVATASCPNRFALSKQASKDAHFLTLICRLAQALKKKVTQKGAVTVQRFCCAIICESLQTTGRALEDKRVRILMPVVLQACSHGRGEYKGFGYVVASLICELVELTQPVRLKLVDAVLKGTKTDGDPRCGLTLLMRILPKKMSTFQSIQRKAPIACCDVPVDTWDDLLQTDNLPLVLGQLNRDIHAGPLIIAIAQYCLEESNLGILKELLREPLLDNIWVEGKLAISLAVAIMNLVAKNSLSCELGQQLLDELHRIDSIGVGEARRHVVTMFKNKGKDSKKRLMKLLRIVSSVSESSKTVSGKEHPVDEGAVLVLLSKFLASDQALASGMKLESLIAKGRVVFTDKICAEIIRCIYHWTFLHKKSKKGQQQRIGELVRSLSFAASALQWLMQRETPERNTLLRLVVAHMNISSDVIETTQADRVAGAATRSLLTAFRVDNDVEIEEALRFLVTNQLILDTVTSPSPASTGHTIIQTKAFVTIIKAIGESENTELMFVALGRLFDAGQSLSLDNEDIRLLLNSIETCTENASVEVVVEFAYKLVQKPSDELFKALSVQAIGALSKSIKGVGSLDFLVEIASREAIPAPRLIKFLGLITKVVKKPDVDVSCLVIPCLALFAHPDASVRRKAVDLVSLLKENGTVSSREAFVALATMLDTEALGTSLVMDGKSTLPTFLRRLVETSPEQKLDILILKNCANATTVKWLPTGRASGGIFAATVVLRAVELAGETSFGLLDRWAHAGRSLFDMLMKGDHDMTHIPTITVQVVLRMMKGISVNDASELGDLIVARGPRGRSYSIGSPKGVTYVSPCPEPIFAAIIECLGTLDYGSASFCERAVEDVISSDTWCEKVYQTMKLDDRLAVANLLLNKLAHNPSDDTLAALVHLPLGLEDIRCLIESHKANHTAISLLMDHIRHNTSTFSTDKELAKAVSNLLFQVLDELSSAADTKPEVEYVFNSMLLALKTLIQSDTDADDALSHAKVLVEMMGVNEISRRKPRFVLASWKSRKNALSALSLLCAINPVTIVRELVPSAMACARSQRMNLASLENSLPSICDILCSILPVFKEHCGSAGLSLLDLFIAFLKEVESARDLIARERLRHTMTRALIVTGDERGCAEFFFLLMIHNVKSEGLVRECVDQMATMDAPVMMKVIVEISAMTGTTIASVMESDVNTNDVAVNRILNLIPGERPLQLETTMHSLRFLSTELLKTVFELETFASYLSKSPAKNLARQLWVGLLHILASYDKVIESFNVQSKVQTDNLKENVIGCKDNSVAALSAMQGMFPTKMFLQCGMSLLEDNERSDLHTRALYSIGERLVYIDSNCTDPNLLLDLVPVSVKFVSGSSRDAQIAAAGLIRKLAKVVLSSKGVAMKAKSALAEALQHMSTILQRQSSELQQKTFQDFMKQPSSCQLTCSVIGSATALVQLLKAQALPQLPVLLQSSLAILAECPPAMDSTHKSGSVRTQLKHLREVMLQSVAAMIDTLPQFVATRLASILIPNILSSFSSVDAMLPKSIATHVPARQLLPAIAKALQQCSECKDCQTLLSLARDSMDRTPASELATLKGYVLQAVLFVCDAHEELLPDVNLVLVGLVMKLSETQMTALFSKMREWRGDDSAQRNYLFWNMAKSLSERLKFLFLPCLSIVEGDARTELNRAVSILCATSASANRKKKVKVGTVNGLGSLPELVECLGHAFASDAQEGGTWIRREEERYQSFMEPLTYLLQSRVPSDFPFHHATIGEGPYHELVMRSGGLISCIVALASAAGDEMLWKPLNHEVLQACGNEDYTEVSKGGLLCLHRLMQRLGEEYMVLLPECLPVLSEFIEAGDETTSAIARDCVQLAETHLGESLQDSLT